MVTFECLPVQDTFTNFCARARRERKSEVVEHRQVAEFEYHPMGSDRTGRVPNPFRPALEG